MSEPIPDGYMPLTGGKIREGDLYWSEAGKEWTTVTWSAGKDMSEIKSTLHARRIPHLPSSIEILEGKIEIGDYYLSPITYDWMEITKVSMLANQEKSTLKGWKVRRVIAPAYDNWGDF